MTVALGIDRLCGDHSLVPGSRWGLLTNVSATTADVVPTAMALCRSGAPIVALLGPEHGFKGTAQAGLADADERDPVTGLIVVDTYLKDSTDLDRELSALDLDAIIADIPDVGARFYTYAWSVVDCMRSASRIGLPFYILDRPNPLSGAVCEGPGVAPECEGFLGRVNIPVRHGMTLGELARHAAASDQRGDMATAEPQVIRMRGWDRQMLWEDAGVSWVMPSPNLATPDTARVYPGTALFEGTTISEGRGTTRPFEIIGAPWLDEDYADRLNACELPGVRFRPTWFTPTFSKWAGEICGGVQLHVTDRRAFEPVRTGMTMLRAAREHDSFEWITHSSRPMIDFLWGSDALREGLDAGKDIGEIVDVSPVPETRLSEPLY